MIEIKIKKYPFMINKKPRIRKTGITALMALVLSTGAGLTQSCTQDVLEGQPSWLGNSIYERLQNYGNYKYTIRLIDDLGQTAVLNRTGSKTLFVADDAAFEEFFKSNDWGVRRYEDLSNGQKKILLNSAMVNNAYLIELLSNLQGNPPQEGLCMRRETAVSVLDSVSRIMPADMPATEYWDKYRGNGKGIVLLQDNTGKPMIHFLPAYMQYNKITSNDLSILTNGASQSTSDSWVNGKKVIESDITCKNGYLHKVDGVMVQSDNMAQIINNHANMSTFARMINRFSAPYYDDAATKEYNRLYNNSDSVFTLKYFSASGNTGYYGAQKLGEVSSDPNGINVEAKLLFDPGWNQYFPSGSSDKDLHYDCGAMLVPSNQALEAWWNAGGKVLQDMYGSWDNVPVKVLVKLLNIGMINSFSETVPSKFENIVDNTTKVSIGITPADVDSCFMGCNGVVYLTNKVFPPADYSSVSFPALVNEKTMNVIYWGISSIPNNSFEPYLNSMDSYYSFFIPTNTAMLEYVDPCSYGNTTQVLYQFYFDNDSKTVKAHRYKYDLANHSIGESLTDATDSQVQNRLVDMINNLIVVGNVEDGKVFYKTKSGGYLKIANAGKAGSMTVAGGLQVEQGNALKIESITDKSKDGNGKSYILNEAMPMTSQKSAYAILKAHPEFSRFYELIAGSGSVSTKDALMIAKSGSNTCADMNISLFDAYNYTMYIPTNEAIEKLHEDGYLPYWTDIENLSVNDFGGNNNDFKTAKQALSARIINFLKYHIQDNSVIIGGSDNNNVKYETFTNNPANKRFYSVTVTSDNNSLEITDQTGNHHSVTKTSGLYNIQGREYWIKNKDTDMDLIYNASDVVVHQIDGALIYNQAEQMNSWREAVGLSTSNSKARRR